MNRIFDTEIWKPISFDMEFTNEFTMEISNHGRVRSFNKISNGRILKGSITEGYNIIRLKLYRPRDQKTEEKFIELKNEISNLYKLRREQEISIETVRAREHLTKNIETKKLELSKKLLKDLKKRTINHHFLVHRLVARYFLPTPPPEKTVVGHLDYNKLNNHVSNLRWMSPEENQQHQSKSPYVIAEKKWRKYTKKAKIKGQKLTTTEVMHIKIQLRRNKPARQIAKQFDISEMQVYRIKRGENWSHITIPD
ncbi:hypothetical protein GV828_00680 [Flavobacterium sp. NST-5]|uniref:HNH nuclease domain-containing protein n=1 Tax=Flavobacterium ichthyis TaxID=2698827 RepID=A0ABW9Z4E3_9FLAO|nr:HNH endonuclease [Flavobacterium ichthyis]NBL63708.1 hypothetical protein [Flavobacterium ichthyis]